MITHPTHATHLTPLLYLPHRAPHQRTTHASVGRIGQQSADSTSQRQLGSPEAGTHGWAMVQGHPCAAGLTTCLWGELLGSLRVTLWWCLLHWNDWTARSRSRVILASATIVLYTRLLYLPTYPWSGNGARHLQYDRSGPTAGWAGDDLHLRAGGDGGGGLLPWWLGVGEVSGFFFWLGTEEVRRYVSCRLI